MFKPIILCGGTGTRLWPLSRAAFPKQFSRVFGNESLFQGSARRLSGEIYGSPIILTEARFRYVVEQQLDELGLRPGAILLEPDGRNTAPAILAAATWLAAAGDPDRLV